MWRAYVRKYLFSTQFFNNSNNLNNCRSWTIWTRATNNELKTLVNTKMTNIYSTFSQLTYINDKNGSLKLHKVAADCLKFESLDKSVNSFGRKRAEMELMKISKAVTAKKILEAQTFNSQGLSEYDAVFYEFLFSIKRKFHPPDFFEMFLLSPFLICLYILRNRLILILREYGRIMRKI